MILSQLIHHNRYLNRIMPILIGLLMMCNLYPQDPLKIVPLGNSITQAKTASPGANSYRRNLWNKMINAGYSVDFVGSLNTDDLGNAFPDASFDHDHEGHWGWRADQIVTYLAGWLAGYTPDVALLHIGTNDAYQNNTVASTIEEIENIIGILRNDNPDVTIFLAQILPLQDVAKNAKVDGINAELVTLASSLNQTQSRIIIVDHNSGWNITEFTYDNVHPNEAGEEIMAQRWFNAFSAFYSSNEPPEITGQNTLSVDEDHTLTLTLSDFNIDDPDTDPDDLTLTVSGGSNYSVSGTTITPDLNWNGTLSVPVYAFDGTTTSNTFNASVWINAVNDAPVVTDIPDQTIDQGGRFEVINLSDYVFDDETPDTGIIWTVGGVLNLVIEITNQEATISSVDDTWSGTELIVFTATDDHPTGPLSNSDEVKFTIDVPSAVANTAVETTILYPNPANGFVNLVFETDPSQNTVIEITSINGAVVLKETIQSAGRNPYRLYIDHLISGTYTVRIVTDDKSNEIVLIKN